MGNYMKRRRRSTNIDITPLMDLTFMLLIIFIITVPAMEYSTDVTPPSMDTPKTVESITDKLVVTLGKRGGVTVDGESVALTPIEYNILHLLMKNPGHIYSSAQIYELVWKEDSLGAETSVSVHIRHLRQKIEINPSEPRYLKVVWGLGYKMEDRV